MSYAYEWDNGQQLVVENDGARTLVALSSRSEGQRQSQTVGFDTGPWSASPLLFRMHTDLVLCIEAQSSPQFLLVRAGTVRRLDDQPDLNQAEKLSLHPTERPVTMKPLEPMKPLAPLKPLEPIPPMEPMKPMAPLRPMPPMEMQLGDMRMSMGGNKPVGERKPTEERALRFCTQCGEPVQESDRFCGQCGQPLRATH
ncbi:MAG TPA: zinc-ribbon domain-containing protein [Chthoniobacterales bacterium]